MSKLRKDPTSVYKERAKAAANSLPRNYRDILLSNYPEYNNEEGRKLISRVVFGNSADIVLTEILEKIAKGELTLKAA